MLFYFSQNDIDRKFEIFARLMSDLYCKMTYLTIKYPYLKQPIQAKVTICKNIKSTIEQSTNTLLEVNRIEIQQTA